MVKNLFKKFHYLFVAIGIVVVLWGGILMIKLFIVPHANGLYLISGFTGEGLNINFSGIDKFVLELPTERNCTGCYYFIKKIIALHKNEHNILVYSYEDRDIGGVNIYNFNLQSQEKWHLSRADFEVRTMIIDQSLYVVGASSIAKIDLKSGKNTWEISKDDRCKISKNLDKLDYTDPYQCDWSINSLEISRESDSKILIKDRDSSLVLEIDDSSGGMKRVN